MKKGSGKLIVGVVFLIIAVISFFISVNYSSVGRVPGLIFLFTFFVSMVFLIWGAINLFRENKQVVYSPQVNYQVRPNQSVSPMNPSS